MHLIALVILVYVVTVLQSAAVPFIAVNTIRPDLLVIVAVHYALVARTYDALLACWLIGLAIDLSGISYQNHGNVGGLRIVAGPDRRADRQTAELYFPR